MTVETGNKRPCPPFSKLTFERAPISKPRLIAVSNRTAAGNVKRAGGLAVALRDCLGPDDLWVGWSGRLYDFPTRTARRTTEEGINFALLDLSKPEYEGFYLGYSNSALWPAVHNRLDLVHFDQESFRAYCKVNRGFAHIIAEEAGPDDLVWIHDFHLFLTARYLRELGVTSRLGMFMHTPFPPAEVFRAVPGHKELGASLAAFDVIGTQTTTDLRNLARYLAEDHGAESVGDHEYRIGSHTLRLLHCPIGMDVEGFAGLPTSKPARKAVKRLSKLVGKNRDFVIGVDRMDYSKGLPERFEGMGLVFDQYPEMHGKLSFLQIAPPSRSDVQEYQDLRERLDRLSGRINGDYGDLDWVPIRYLAKGYPREELAGLFRYAKVGLVTPLQDGMNLVAKEYIAAQDPEDPGVLVLSQFAGAAEQMSQGGEGALIVNPHDHQAIAHAVIRALRMPLDERRRRWQVLYEGMEAQDIAWWRDRFLAALAHKTVSESIAAE